MKVRSTVLGLHIAAIVAFSLLQGCVTPESQGSGRGAGARHKGPWKHQHKGNASTQVAVANSMYQPSDQAAGSVYEPVIIESEPSRMPDPVYEAPVTPTANTETYIVQKGDILSRLATKFDTTTKTLISLNHLSNPDVLYVGQELRVPAGSYSSSNYSKTKSSSSVKKGGDYVVQKGDTLSGIAVAAGVSLKDLRSLNNISDDKIFAGESISIPRGGKVPSSTRKSTPKKKAPPVEPAPAMAEPAPAPMAALDPEIVPVETSSLQVDAVIDHVVYPGESLEDISRQYGVSKSEIMRLNNISDAASVKEGQRLRIPIAE